MKEKLHEIKENLSSIKRLNTS